jgi:DNA-binding CsgD family transcriptional regulator
MKRSTSRAAFKIEVHVYYDYYPAGDAAMIRGHLTDPWKDVRGDFAEFPTSPSMVESETFLSLGQAVFDTFERLGYGAILVDEAECILKINATARNLLRQNLGRASQQSEVDWIRSAIRRLPERATPWFPKDTEAWRTLPCDGERPLMLQRIPLSRGSDRPGYFVVILADFDGRPQANPETLRRIFGLTGAEAKLAIRIPFGETPAEIARDLGVSVATIRCQLASIFAKTQTRRQTELATLLMRIAILP